MMYRACLLMNAMVLAPERAHNCEVMGALHGSQIASPGAISFNNHHRLCDHRPVLFIHSRMVRRPVGWSVVLIETAAWTLGYKDMTLVSLLSLLPESH